MIASHMAAEQGLNTENENLHEHLAAHNTERNYANDANDWSCPWSQTPVSLTRNLRLNVPVKPFEFDARVPRVEFATPMEYDRDIDHLMRTFANFVRHVISTWMSIDANEKRLTWTQRDMVVSGLADFPELYSHGLSLILRLCRGKGFSWCKVVTSRIVESMLTSYRSFVRVVMGWNPTLDSNVFTIGVQNEMITTMYESSHWLNELFDANFLTICTSNLNVVHLIPRYVWEEILLLFFCAMQDNQASTGLSALHQDVGIQLRRLLSF